MAIQMYRRSFLDTLYMPCLFLYIMHILYMLFNSTNIDNTKKKTAKKLIILSIIFYFFILLKNKKIIRIFNTSDYFLLIILKY